MWSAQLPAISSKMTSVVAESIGDAGSSRLVVGLVIGLVVLGIGLLILAVWVSRTTRYEPEALGPLAVMSDSAWVDADDDTRQELLDAARPVSGEDDGRSQQVVDPDADVDEPDDDLVDPDDDVDEPDEVLVAVAAESPPVATVFDGDLDDEIGDPVVDELVIADAVEATQVIPVVTQQRPREAPAPSTTSKAASAKVAAPAARPSAPRKRERAERRSAQRPVAPQPERQPASRPAVDKATDAAAASSAGTASTNKPPASSSATSQRARREPKQPSPEAVTQPSKATRVEPAPASDTPAVKVSPKEQPASKPSPERASTPQPQSSPQPKTQPQPQPKSQAAAQPASASANDEAAAATAATQRPPSRPSDTPQPQTSRPPESVGTQPARPRRVVDVSTTPIVAGDAAAASSPTPKSRSTAPSRERPRAVEPQQRRPRVVKQPVDHVQQPPAPESQASDTSQKPSEPEVVISSHDSHEAASAEQMPLIPSAAAEAMAVEASLFPDAPDVIVVGNPPFVGRKSNDDAEGHASDD